MLNALARGSVSKVTDPIGTALLRIGLSPDLVTVLGTVGVVAGSLVLIAPGHLFAGCMVVTLFVFFDLFDGAMARARGYGTRFGLVLDASCDRIADGTLFGAVAYFCFTHRPEGGAVQLGVASLLVLVAGQVVSYVKARADSVGLSIGGAVAERAERNVLGLVAIGLEGLGVPYALAIGLWLLAALCLITVVQRLVQVRVADQAHPETATTLAGAGPAGTAAPEGTAAPAGTAVPDEPRPTAAPRRAGRSSRADRRPGARSAAR